MHPELVVLYIVAGAFTAAIAGLTMPTGLSSLPATFISMSICLLWPLFLWPALSALTEAARRGLAHTLLAAGRLHEAEAWARNGQR